MGLLYDWMVRRSTPRAAVTSYVIAIVALVTYLFYVAELDAMIGWGGKLDLRPGGYGLAEVNSLFVELGPDGRSLYTRSTIGDTIWPLLAGVSAILAAPQVVRARWSVLALGLLPMAFGLIDLAENIGLLVLLASHPDVPETTVTVTSVLTQVKLLLVLPPAFIAWFGIPVLAYRRHTGSSQTEEHEVPTRPCQEVAQG